MVALSPGIPPRPGGQTGEAVLVGLKDCAWERSDDALIVMLDRRAMTHLVDRDGSVELLLTTLRDQPRSPEDLRQVLVAAGVQVDAEQLAAVLDVLDQAGLVEDATGLGLDDPQLDARHFSNLAFFGQFSDLKCSRASFLRRMRRAHVVQLGVGGGGSAIVQCLAGMGVGRLTLVDRDDVEPRNFSRQFLYRHADLGRSKVDRAAEWVREYDPTIEVRAVDRWIGRADDLDGLFDGADVVTGSFDEPPGAQAWVNQAVVGAGIPLVSGALFGTQLVYSSVDPGRSACQACAAARLSDGQSPGAEGLAVRLDERLPRTNRLTGPVAAIVGALIAQEAARYITGFQPPYAAGAVVFLDVRNGFESHRMPITRDPDCEICRQAADVRSRRPSAVRR
ncbi:MAG TPA: TOMM precursor leader peptide-binding protein [Acidimicrobiales bacterium]|nr:TOMM precursor leader peptide-binding protein [Acidimicrobiales bacterium]